MRCTQNWVRLMWSTVFDQGLTNLDVNTESKDWIKHPTEWKHTGWKVGSRKAEVVSRKWPFSWPPMSLSSASFSGAFQRISDRARDWLSAREHGKGETENAWAFPRSFVPMLNLPMFHCANYSSASSFLSAFFPTRLRRLVTRQVLVLVLKQRVVKENLQLPFAWVYLMCSSVYNTPQSV